MNIKWAKPIERKSRNQQVSHAVFILMTPILLIFSSEMDSSLARQSFPPGKKNVNPSAA
jgi:hypothetical protein